MEVNGQLDSLSIEQREVLRAITGSLPLSADFYQQISERVGLPVAQIIQEIQNLKNKGILKRFGLVLNHQRIGYVSNAMVVWEICPKEIDAIGIIFKNSGLVSLCYQRPKITNVWPYNLFTMIHSTSEVELKGKIDHLVEILSKEKYSFNFKVLRTIAKFKQKGADYFRQLEDIDQSILNEYQNGLPIVSHPYREMAERFGVTEYEVVFRIRKLLEMKKLTRFGPMFNIDKGGGLFVLCAMSIPEFDFERVTEIVNQRIEVAHNYRRNNKLNMWFVIAVENKDDVGGLLKHLEDTTGYRVFAFPKIKEFLVNLRFKI